MSTSLASYAPRFIGQHLMIHHATAAAIASGLGGLAPSDSTPEASRFRGAPSGGGTRYRVETGAALVTIEGPLCNRGTWLGSSWGGACYEGLSAQLASIMSDSAVDRIVLDLNTPGGEVAGCFEFVAELRAAAARKPVTAFVNGMACSAGYAIASAASRIVVRARLTTLTGLLGCDSPSACGRTEAALGTRASQIRPNAIEAISRTRNGPPWSRFCRNRPALEVLVVWTCARS